MDDLIAILRKRWDRGQYLRAYAAGEQWQPIELNVKAPTAAEILADVDAAARWAERFERDSHHNNGAPRFSIEYRTIKGNGLGTNNVAARVRIETFNELCALLRTRAEAGVLDALMATTRAAAPSLTGWVVGHPLDAIAHHTVWPLLLAVVQWIETHDPTKYYLRQIDIPGVDTKFIEQHRKILGQLLQETLPAERVDLERSNFAERFKFRTKPQYVRLRLLAPIAMFPPALSELRLRVDELAKVEIPITTVFIIENEISYLAFPTTANAIAIFGEGFALTTLERITWLNNKDIVYWGDIDTHGFAILNRLRQRFPTTRSVLMDRHTLLAHPHQLAVEPNPTTGPLPHLTESEQSLYTALIEDRHGKSIRLEQERIRFSHISEALQQIATA